MSGSLPNHPIICGRRNCSRCLRWRHAVDFQWVWKRKGAGHYVPQVKSICNHCKNNKERERYNKLTPAEKRDKGRRANEQAKVRRNALKEENAKLGARVETLEERVKKWRARVGNAKTKYGDDTLVDILPMRMFLLRQIRLRGSIKAVAELTEIDESRIRRIADGYYWESDCRPVPVRTISLGLVDTLLTRLDGEGLLPDLYPEAHWEE